MTHDEANALHNPFIRNGKFNFDLQINCTDHDPNCSLLNRAAVALAFPNQAWIEIVSTVPTINALFIDRPKAKDLSAVTKLALTNLTMSYPSHVKDWSFLRDLPSLVRLSLHNTLSLPDLSEISTLSRLEVFQISGGYSKILRLPSLAPLASCERLVAIDLAAVKCADWSLKPLFGLPNLQRFDCPLDWPIGEVQSLLNQNKRLSCNVTEYTKR